MSSLNLQEITLRARAAGHALTQASSIQKNLALNAVARSLLSHASQMAEFEPRFGTLESAVKEIFQIMELADPVGDIYDSTTRTNGLKLTKYCIPIGVLGFVLDENPRQILMVCALAIKSANSIIVWTDSLNSPLSQLIIKIVRAGLEAADLPMDAVQLLPGSDEKTLIEFLRFSQDVDLILQEGSAKLNEVCEKNRLIPSTHEKHAVCHLYIDQYINIEKAVDVVVNSKKSQIDGRHTVSTLLVHEHIAQTFLSHLFSTLKEEQQLSFRLDSKSWNLFLSIFTDPGQSQIAESKDWEVLWNHLILNIKVVHDLEEAIEHIRLYGSGDCEGILSELPMEAMKFVSLVNATALLINASLQCFEENRMNIYHPLFINCQKLGKSEPSELNALMSFKWLIQGNYHLN